MANTPLTIVDSRYSTNVTGAWKGANETQIWSGEPSDYSYSYFSYIEIEVGNIEMVSSSMLVLKFELDQSSYLGGVLGVLSNEKLDSTQIQNSDFTGMSTTLSAAAIATSKACDENGTEYTYGNTAFASGNYFYLVFNTAAIVANTKYYVYLLPTATQYCWVSSDRSKTTAELSYINHTPCGAPTAFSVTQKLFEETVTLQWSGATNGTSNAITGYLIQSSDSNDGITWGSWVTLKTVSTAESSGSITDTPGIARGAYRRYRIRTQGVAGEAYYSEYSAAIPLVQKNRLPVEPVSAYLDKEEYSPGDEITLTWSGASDADNNIAEYIIGVRNTEVDAWTTHGKVASTAGSGSYTLQPQKTEYLQRIYVAVRVVDALGATSAWKIAGSVLRNDNPYAYIRSDDCGAYAAGTDKHLVTIAEVTDNPSGFAKYMPYIFDGESWQRCIE